MLLFIVIEYILKHLKQFQVDTQAIFIPEEDRWISILELNENDRFLEFYHSMLQLYEAVCGQSNNYVAHQVCKLIDERQLMYCIQNQCKDIFNYGVELIVL